MALLVQGAPALPVIILDANGNQITSFGGGSSTITGPLGRQSDAASVSTALSTEDVALITSRLPTGAALADGTANPTATGIGALLLGWNGATWDRVRVQSFRVDLSAVSITSIATVWTPTSGKKFRLMGGSISVSAACNVLFEDNAAGAGNFVWRTPTLLAATPYNFDLGNGKLSATVNNVLKATASAAATITGTLYGTEE